MIAPQRIYPTLKRAERVVRPPVVMHVKPLDNATWLELCRSLWAELHSKEAPTPEWFADWLSRVPRFGCNCQSWTKDYIAENPVEYDNFKHWAWKFHNAVNAKLGKPLWPIDSQTPTA